MFYYDLVGSSENVVAIALWCITFVLLFQLKGWGLYAESLGESDYLDVFKDDYEL